MIKFDDQFPIVTAESKTPVSSLCPPSGRVANRPGLNEKRKTIATFDIDNMARIWNSGPLHLLHIQPGFAPGAGLRFVHPRLPTIMAFGTFHLFHINTVVIRVLITFDCI
jgi:hypothetical protein